MTVDIFYDADRSLLSDWTDSDSSDTESYHSFQSSDTEKDYNKNIEYELYLEKCYNETSICDKEIYVFDYDDTIRLHTLRQEERECYENKLYDYMLSLKKKNKKLYLVSYNLNPFGSSFTKDFNKRFSVLFDGLIYPQPIPENKFTNKTAYNYTCRCGYYYVYTPKHIDIIEIAEKHKVPLNKVIFFDDNAEQIKLAREAGIPSIHVSIKFGVPMP